MTGSLSAARTALQSVKQKQQNIEMTDGISLLSLKHHILISYLRSLVLVSSRRLLGDSLIERSPPSQPFSAVERGRRGIGAGDIVDTLLEDRVILEKIDVLDSKMRYQIEKLVRIAEEPATSNDATEDPLVFKPNPQALVPESAEKTDSRDSYGGDYDQEDQIYRPPRLAPMPYVEKSKNQSRKDRPPVPSALANLAADPHRPYEETTSGLGGTAALASGRAKYLKRVQDYEEDNFTRLIMKKSDAKRRARDEADLALGADLGGGGPSRRSRAGGLEDEFNDVLRSVNRVSGGRSQGDGYEELRKRGKKASVIERSKQKRDHAETEMDVEEPAPRMKKRTRFELDTKTAKKKIKKH
ncbi:hypothetical protein CPB83DRAFT_867622 [Crepidotus variabilis]|uniref:Neuroguidin n=1 Tax=Crepidotus variabilis TaxID=179855 RepID=A0A9P6JTE9_9AGAR|nr:hypothetical protein CPB83DRAFT_867622 [Crepidotus variabilis]